MRRRIVTGSVARPIIVGALVTAVAMMAPTGASALPTHGADRTAPSQGATAAKPAPPGGIAAAAASADRLVQSKPEVLKAGKHDRFKAGKVLTSMGLNYVPYERTYRGLPVVGGDFVVSTDDKGKILATSVAQTRQVKLHSTKATVARTAARATSQRQLRHAQLGKTRLVVLQTKHSRLAWETWVSGKKHGEASRLTVYVDARTGRVLTTKEHVLEGTGNGNWEGSVTIPTSGSGSSFSMTNSNASTLKCQNSSGNATFTGTDDAWGNGSGTDRETGCVDAFYSAEKDAPDALRMAGPQRHERLGRLGADPGRAQRRQRLLRRHAGPDRSPPGNQRVDRLDGRGGARVRPRHRRQDPRRHLRRRDPGVRGRHLRCRDRVVREQPRRRARLPRGRGDQPGRPGSDPQHVQPVGGRRPELLLQLDPQRGGARGGRAGQPLVLPARTGLQPAPVSPASSDLQRLVGHRASASRRPSRSCTTRCS